MIMARTLNQDVAKYNKLDGDDFDDSETGWKLVVSLLRSPLYNWPRPKLSIGRPIPTVFFSSPREAFRPVLV